MKPPTVSLAFTVHERPIHVLKAVFRSIMLQSVTPDQIVICLDRSPQKVAGEVKDWWWGSSKDCLPEIVEIVGSPGWRGPSTAWNAALARVTSELTFMISSEVILAPDSLKIARDYLATRQAVLFGKCTDSSGTQQVTGFPPGLLGSSEYPRPLGFAWCVPTWALRAIDGYDEGFMKGLCFDDDDVSYRLWKLGLPFVFHDGVSGVHQFHERPGLVSEDGIRQQAINREYISRKFSSDNLPVPHAPLTGLYNAGRIVERRKAGVTVWDHAPASRARLRFDS